MLGRDARNALEHAVRAAGQYNVRGIGSNGFLKGVGKQTLATFTTVIRGQGNADAEGREIFPAQQFILITSSQKEMALIRPTTLTDKVRGQKTDGGDTHTAGSQKDAAGYIIYIESFSQGTQKIKRPARREPCHLVCSPAQDTI